MEVILSAILSHDSLLNEMRNNGTDLSWLIQREVRTMILRLSQKLGTKIKAGKSEPLPADADPFIDWSAHVFTMNRVQYIIMANTKSLFSTVFPGKGITNSNLFIEAAHESLRVNLRAYGWERVYFRRIAPSMDSITFAKALNRSVTGSVNDLIRGAKWMIWKGEPLSCFSEHLNSTLLSALASKQTERYGRPQDVFREMISEGTLEGG